MMLNIFSYAYLPSLQPALKFLFMSFAHFLIKPVLLLNFESSLYILDKIPLLNTFANILSVAYLNTIVSGLSFHHL